MIWAFLPAKKRGRVLAKYDRALLVPYFQDICSIHLSIKKTKEKIEKERRKIQKIRNNAIGEVAKPEMETVSQNEPTLGALALGLLTGVLSVGLIISALWNGVIAFCAGLCALVGAYAIPIYSYKKCKNENAAANERNAAKKEEYEREKQAALNDAKPVVRKVERQIKFYKEKIEEMESLLTDLYSANLIPKRYRDLYSAVYLEDWFSNGCSDNLDIALNTFVLERIKDKLDVIIQYHAEELINQRIMIANQNKSMEQRERHHRALMSKLDEIQATNEERNCYLQMIEANTAVDSFFAHASYLRN